MTIVVENLTKNFGEKAVFSDVSFRLEKEEKVGLIGANGEGKTTLMRILLGFEEYDGGKVQIDKMIKIGYAAQNAKVSGTLWQQLASDSKEIFALQKQMRTLEKEISLQKDEQSLEELLKQYALLEQSYEHAGGYSHEQDIRKVAFALGFSEEDFDKDASAFSGGQKTRMHLATALLGEPDFLFLDEPTNHLDVAMIEWLEGYLAEYRGGLLLVSHDRYFLDRVVKKILYMQAGKLKVYRGNYSDFAKQKEQQDEALAAAYEKQQEHIKETEEYIRRYKAGIKSKQARGRQSQLNRLERIEAPIRMQEFKLRLPQPPESADKVLALEKIFVGYGEPLLKNISLVVKKGEKVALLGENGAGKTTLLKTIMGDMQPLHGEREFGKRVRPGYFSQGHDGLFGSQTVLEHLQMNYDLSEERARTLLGGMLFRGDDVFKELGTLSGGERARVALLKLILEGANLLILDEPTNHLDIKSCEIVEDALLYWQGTILFVSHDRYFVDKIATKIWTIEDNKVTEYIGDYAYYKSKQQELEVQKKQAVIKETIALPVSNITFKSKRPQNLEKRIETVELSLREQDALLRFLEKRLADPLEHVDFEASSVLAQEYADKKKLVDDLLAQWEQLLHMQENS